MDQRAETDEGSAAMNEPTSTKRVEARREALAWLARRLAWERTLADLRQGDGATVEAA